MLIVALTHDELRHLIYVHGQRVVQKLSIDSVFILLRVCLRKGGGTSREKRGIVLGLGEKFANWCSSAEEATYHWPLVLL